MWRVLSELASFGECPSWEEVGFLPKNFPSTQKVHLPLRKKTGGALYSDFSERCEARQEAPSSPSVPPNE